ncbi:MAG: sigma 54-interacting transcriptional regulator, partial [Verrucomicrobiota bacterium]
SSERKDRNLATLLTMTLGSMGDVLTQVEVLARRFREALPMLNGKPDAAIKEYLNAIEVLLKGNRRPCGEQPSLKIGESPDGLPKLLLRGDSGVGKSLIAEFLHTKTRWGGRPVRIPIPEYLRKEDMFEYDLFGYCKGAYTGGKDEGSLGLLLGNAGRVVFLDEIGEANEYLQAKLLAFLDDYKVRPRGWEGDPFFCPVLVVAATNKDLEQMVLNKEFRGDLLARFTSRLTIPGLRERIDDLPFILDCLLQRPGMNSGGKIHEIGQQAFDSLKSRDFKEGNFRELETLFRLACERANRDGRAYIVKTDIE